MTREEKIEIMFESVLSEMENISRKIGKMKPEKNDSGKPSMDQKLDDFMAAILDIRIPVYRPDYGALIKRLDRIAEDIHSLKALSQQAGSQKGAKITIQWLLVILLPASLALNIYLLLILSG